jgi:hypothetical protein
MDRHPARVAGGQYYHWCWPCYFTFCRQFDFPAIVNYIDLTDKDDNLRWDAARQANV